MWVSVKLFFLFFFFKQKTAYEMRISDWSSDVCSSDLHAENLLREAGILEGEDDDLYSPHNIHVVHHLNAGLRAHGIYQRDVDYIVRDGEVIIVAEFTGRTLTGRRWSDGLHPAVEAKQGVPVQLENPTQARITLQTLPPPQPTHPTNTPPTQGAAGPPACTRRSRPRKACRSSARTRPWPASPSRTCSACTTSSRA